MKIKIQVVIETEGSNEVVQEVAQLKRGALRVEEFGLTLAEAKAVLQGVQQTMVEQQSAEYLAQQACCGQCGNRRLHKGTHQIVYRTLFGKLRLESPRLYHCGCQPQGTRTFSPLAELLKERTAPELLFVESKFAALMSYGLAADVLEQLLPIGRTVHPATVRNHVHAVAERMEAALGEEKVCFIEGCERDWKQLPQPALPLTVELDGGFVHSSEQTSRTDGWFEVITGKSMAATRAAKCFAFVNTYDQKPKRRRNGERISTATAESTVNQVISKRMVKKQQTRWSRRGAHLFLQVRTRELNGELQRTFAGCIQV